MDVVLILIAVVASGILGRRYGYEAGYRQASIDTSVVYGMLMESARKSRESSTEG